MSLHWARDIIVGKVCQNICSLDRPILSVGAGSMNRDFKPKTIEFKPVKLDKLGVLSAKAMPHGLQFGGAADPQLMSADILTGAPAETFRFRKRFFSRLQWRHHHKARARYQCTLAEAWIS